MCARGVASNHPILIIVSYIHDPQWFPISSMESSLDAKSNEWWLWKLQDEVVDQVLLADQPSKRFVGIDEVAAFVTFLCSDSARSVTGSMLSCDGGWTAR